MKQATTHNLGLSNACSLFLELTSRLTRLSAEFTKRTRAAAVKALEDSVMADGDAAPHPLRLFLIPPILPQRVLHFPPIKYFRCWFWSSTPHLLLRTLWTGLDTSGANILLVLPSNFPLMKPFLMMSRPAGSRRLNSFLNTNSINSNTNSNKRKRGNKNSFGQRDVAMQPTPTASKPTPPAVEPLVIYYS